MKRNESDKMKEKDSKTFMTRDAEFHENLVRARASERLLALYQTRRRHMSRYRIESLCLPRTMLRNIKGHRRIVDCIRKKDERGIKFTIREHLEQSNHGIHRCALLEADKKDQVFRKEN